jgi:uncharacterized membrane protein YdbT with pleckstrin-like domain
MSYVNRTLGDREKIRYATGYHWIFWVGVWVLIIPFLFIAVAGIPYAPWDYVLLAMAAFPMFYGVSRFIHGYALELVVTTDRFVKKTGLISITTEEVSLDKIEEVNVEETILGRILGYGEVHVHGTGAGKIRVRLVNNPVRLRREIQSARENTKGE